MINGPVFDHVYEFTARGAAVYDAWQSLPEAPSVKGADTRWDEGRVALDLIAPYLRDPKGTDTSPVE